MQIISFIIATMLATSVAVTTSLAQTTKIVYTLGGDLYLQGMSDSTPVGSSIRLTSTKGNSESNPELSPDGSKVVFQARGGLYIMNAAPEGLANPRLPLSSFGAVPAWSPTGEKI